MKIKQMKKLEYLLSKIEKDIPLFEKKNTSVSQVSIGWQLEHVMLVMNSIIKAIEVSEPADYIYKWNLSRVVVMTTGNIPRGKAKAPSRVQPREEFTETSLKMHLAKTRESVGKLSYMSNNQFFPHPSLGHMKLKTTIKFLGIHTKHHLKIVDDILKS